MEIRERVKALLKELISIRSISGREESIQRFIEERLKKKGVSLEKQEVERGRYNLLYRGRKPYLISCHVDTVPSLGMRDAFKPKEVNGRIYGRGASDVKGAIASLITAVEVFKELHPEEEIPVSIAFVVDEENNSALGSEKIRERLKEHQFCIVLEPTYGLICTSQYGTLEFSLVVRGESVHGAEFEKTENPVKVLMKILGILEEKLSRPVNVLRIRGGSGHYVVPESCHALMEVKLFRGESWEEVDRRIREILKGIETSCKVDYKLEDAENYIEFRCNGFAEFLGSVYEEANGERPKRGEMPSWTDAANYHNHGYSCVVFGHGSLKESHTDREGISVEELERMTRFFLKLFERLR